MAREEPVGAQRKDVVDKREGRERLILDTAARLFRERGYASTTIRDIAGATGLNTATPHYYFGSKPAILFRIYQDTFDAFDDVDGAMDQPPLDRLMTIARAGAMETATHPDYVAVFFQEFRFLDQHLPDDMAKTLRERESRFTRRLRDLVEEAIAEGTVRAVDPRAVVSNLVATTAWSYQWYRPDQDTTPEGIADTCVDLLFNGLRT